ncbi:MAG: hypothetical protein IT266_04600 [Saprospiraceae bacterium]|nr:hypothetical protein [Saprospiraceae bacterium]
MNELLKAGKKKPATCTVGGFPTQMLSVGTAAFKIAVDDFAVAGIRLNKTSMAGIMSVAILTV